MKLIYLVLCRTNAVFVPFISLNVKFGPIIGDTIN